MRDLSRFKDNSYDIVYHPYSINFIPEPVDVFKGVRRILRNNGIYRVSFGNPIYLSMDEKLYDGRGYLIVKPYVDGEIIWDEPEREVWHEDGSMVKVNGPREFRHTLGTFINKLIQNGFEIIGLWEELSNIPDPEPGKWEHFKSFVPPWYMLWTKLHK
jgi:ubiquinone/menaquinone biosynthesis C-methylase UbiE